MGRVQHLDGPGYVDAVGGDGIGDGPDDRRERGVVQHEVHAAHRLRARRGVGDAPRDHAHAVLDTGEILARAAREIVEDDHVVP